MIRWTLWILFFMVSEVVSSTETKDFNVGRAFAHCTKLTRGNYDIWLTGLISTLVGITGYTTLKSVQRFFEFFEKDGSGKEDELQVKFQAYIAALPKVPITPAKTKIEIVDTGTSSSDDEDWDLINELMYTIIHTTLDASKEIQLAKTATMAKYRKKGVVLMKYIHDRYGPGGASRQTAKKLKIQEEKQSDEETGEEFCDRLIQDNASLTTPIDGTMMCSIFIKGLNDPDLQKYLLGEQLKSNITELEEMKDKCDEYEVQHGILTHGVSGMYAGIGGARGRGRGGRALGRGRGRGRSDEVRKCLFCGIPYHYWRACRLLNRAKRHSNTTSEQHAQMDRRRDELLRQCPPDFRQQINEFLREQGTVPQIEAQIAQPKSQAQLEFPNIDGRLAEVCMEVVETDNAPTLEQSKKLGTTYDMNAVVMNKLWKLFLAVLAFFMSCSGMILMVSLCVQFGGTSAQQAVAFEDNVETVVAKNISLPSYAKLQQSSSMGEIDKDALIAMPLYNKSAGVPWDTCAGINMFNSTAPFYKWDKHETRYKIHGATASDYSKGSGRVLIGFCDDDCVGWFLHPLVGSGA